MKLGEADKIENIYIALGKFDYLKKTERMIESFSCVTVLRNVVQLSLCRFGEVNRQTTNLC